MRPKEKKRKDKKVKKNAKKETRGRKPAKASKSKKVASSSDSSDSNIPQHLSLKSYVMLIKLIKQLRLFQCLRHWVHLGADFAEGGQKCTGKKNSVPRAEKLRWLKSINEDKFAQSAWFAF